MPQPKDGQKDFGILLVQSVQITADILFLLLNVLFSIILSFVRLFMPKQLRPVRGEIVLITGAGHGMGKELALLYASEGATVVVWDINEELGKKTVNEIAQRNYPKAHFFKCDVSNRDDVMNVARQLQENIGDVTILINNAGIMPTHSFLDHTKEEIERIMNINVMAHFWTLQAFLPAMKKNNYGHVVSMSSMAGIVGLTNLVPYCCSKFAVRGLMDALNTEFREDLKSDVKFTSVHPYMVDTGLCKKPKIRFENAMPMVKADEAAVEIMKAQRLGLSEMSIPRHMLGGYNFLKLFPERARHLISDFCAVGLQSDLK